MIELTFPASTTVLCVNISISGDLDLEDDEVFTVQLDSSDRAILFRPSSATVTITDDDSKHHCAILLLAPSVFSHFTSHITIPFSDVAVGVQQVSYSVREADGLVRVCAILTGDTQREVLANLTTLSGSALGQLSHTYEQECMHSCSHMETELKWMRCTLLQLTMTLLQQSHHWCLGPQLLNSVQTLAFHKTVSWKRLKTSQCS